MKIYFVELPDFSPESLPTLLDNFQQLENLLDYTGLEENNFAVGTITDVSIAPGALHRVSFSDDVPRSAGGQYTGDGLANRIITLGWMPRRVTILSHTDLVSFEGIGDGVSALASWWRTSTGAMSSGLTDWQGMVATGFKLGSSAANLANKVGLLYSWFALR